MPGYSPLLVCSMKSFHEKLYRLDWPPHPPIVKCSLWHIICVLHCCTLVNFLSITEHTQVIYCPHFSDASSDCTHNSLGLLRIVIRIALYKWQIKHASLSSSNNMLKRFVLSLSRLYCCPAFVRISSTRSGRASSCRLSSGFQVKR